MKLYEFQRSGHSHKARLMLALLGLEYESVALNGQEGEHKSAAFLSKNPFGQVPVLEDGDTTIRDSQAILVYLARQYGAEHWLPLEPAAMAQVMAWLSTAANEIARGPALLRAHHKFGRDINLADAEQTTANLLAILQAQLAGQQWLAGDRISIADIAVYPYIALAPEGNIDLQPYPAITGWLARIQSLEGYTGMPGMWTPTATA
ncbi:MAG: glutathione S-transferase [Sulfuriferula sp.]|nr:glutathione S-transferase [Sulfuriferula sp.]